VGPPAVSGRWARGTAGTAGNDRDGRRSLHTRSSPGRYWPIERATRSTLHTRAGAPVARVPSGGSGAQLCTFGVECSTSGQLCAPARRDVTGHCGACMSGSARPTNTPHRRGLGCTDPRHPLETARNAKHPFRGRAASVVHGDGLG
jgi:hypothetical protein